MSAFNHWAQTNNPTQVWYMIEIMRRDFSEHQEMQVLVTETQRGPMEMMSQITELVGMDYLDVPDSGYVTQTVYVSLFRCQSVIFGS